MTCQEVMEYMQRQLDDDLNEHEADALTAHTRYCSDCADMFERLKRLSAELDNLPKVVPAFSLVDAIIPQLDMIDSERQRSGIAIETALVEPVGVQEAEAVPSRRSARERQRGWLKRISWPAVAGVAAAGLVAGMFLVLFKPADAPQLKNSLAMESTTASTADASNSPASSDMRKQVADEVRIESTNEPETSPMTAQDNFEGAGQSSEAPSHSDESSRIQVVTPYAEVPGQHLQEKNGDAAPLAPSDDPAVSNNSAESNVVQPKAVEPDMSDVAVVVKDQYGEPMGITSSGDSMALTVSNVVVSPDGTYSAAILDGAVLVYTTQEGTVQLDSGKKSGTISGLQWSDDSKALFFEVKDENGQATHYKVDAREWSIVEQ